MQVYDSLLFVSLSCITLIHVKDCLLSCNSCAWKQDCSLFLKVTSSFLCLNMIILGIVIDCRIVRWDLRSTTS